MRGGFHSLSNRVILFNDFNVSNTSSYSRVRYHGPAVVGLIRTPRGTVHLNYLAHSFIHSVLTSDIEDIGTSLSTSTVMIHVTLQPLLRPMSCFLTLPAINFFRPFTIAQPSTLPQLCRICCASLMRYDRIERAGYRWLRLGCDGLGSGGTETLGTGHICQGWLDGRLAEQRTAVTADLMDPTFKWCRAMSASGVAQSPDALVCVVQDKKKLCTISIHATLIFRSRLSQGVRPGPQMCSLPLR